MIIDLVTDEGQQWMRYDSEVAPRVGETISTFQPTKARFVVLSVDHLVGKVVNFDNMKQQLITITAKEI